MLQPPADIVIFLGELPPNYVDKTMRLLVIAG